MNTDEELIGKNNHSTRAFLRQIDSPSKVLHFSQQVKYTYTLQLNQRALSLTDSLCTFFRDHIKALFEQIHFQESE